MNDNDNVTLTLTSIDVRRIRFKMEEAKKRNLEYKAEHPEVIAFQKRCVEDYTDIIKKIDQQYAEQGGDLEVIRSAWF